MKPMLFNTEMVKALLADRKTATRRVAFPEGDLSPFRKKIYPEGWWFRGRVYRNWDDVMKEPQGVMSLCKHHPGDILYVRETWQEVYETEHNVDGSKRTLNIRDLISNFDDISKVAAGISHDYATAAMEPRMKYYVFKASDIEYTDPENGLRWRPSIHIPKDAARIFLRVTDVRVERLQDMTQEDAEKEGCSEKQNPDTKFTSSPLLVFLDLWNNTIKPADLPLYGRDANPWVWAIEFERITKEEALAHDRK